MKRLHALALLTGILLMGAKTLWAQNDHYPQYIRMGNTALNNKNYDLAKEYYEDAIDDYSDCWQAYVGLGNILFAKGKYKEALTQYEKALKMNSDNPDLTRFVNALRARVAPPTPTPVPAAPPPMLPPPGSPLPLPPPGR